MYIDISFSPLDLDFTPVRESSEHKQSFLQKYEEAIDIAITTGDCKKILAHYQKFHEKFITFMEQKTDDDQELLNKIYEQGTAKVVAAIIKSQNIKYLLRLEQMMGGISPFPEYAQDYDRYLVTVETALLQADFGTYFHQSKLFQMPYYRRKALTEEQDFNQFLLKIEVLLNLGKPDILLRYLDEEEETNFHIIEKINLVNLFYQAKNPARMYYAFQQYRKAIMTAYLKPDNAPKIYQLAERIIDLASYEYSPFNDGITLLSILIVLEEALIKIGNQTILDNYKKQLEKIYPQLEKGLDVATYQKRLAECQILGKDTYPINLMTVSSKREEAAALNRAWDNVRMPNDQQMLLLLEKCTLEEILKEDYIDYGLQSCDVLPILIQKGLTFHQFIQFPEREKLLELQMFLGLYRNEQNVSSNLTLAQALKQLDKIGIMLYQNLPVTDHLYEAELIELSALSFEHDNLALSTLSSLIEYPMKLRIYLNALQQRDVIKYYLYHDAFFGQQQFEKQDKIYYYHYRARKNYK